MEDNHLGTINCEEESKEFFTVTRPSKDPDSTGFQFLRQEYHGDYYGWWTDNIEEAGHFFAHDAISKAEEYHGQATRVVESVGKFDLFRIGFGDVKPYLFGKLEDACLTYQMKCGKDSGFRDTYTGFVYPDKWIETFKEIRDFAKSKLEDLRKEYGLDDEVTKW